MPRVVPPWVWRKALRDRGPRSPSLLLTLYTIATFMNRDGYAFPGFDLIAKGARTSTRTVQRHIAEARRTGWLGVEAAGTKKGWRKNSYRAAIPDDLELDETEERMADGLLAQEGEIGDEGDDTYMSSAKATGDDTRMSSASKSRDRFERVPEPVGDDKRHLTPAKVTTSEARGDDTGRNNVTTPASTNSLTHQGTCARNSHSETPISNSHTDSEEAHSAQSRAASGVCENRNGEKEIWEAQLDSTVRALIPKGFTDKYQIAHQINLRSGQLIDFAHIEASIARVRAKQ